MKFKKIAIGFAALVAFAFGAFMYLQNRGVEVYSETNEVYKIGSEKKPLCVFVWTSGCGNCVYSLPHISSLKDRFESMGGRFILVLGDDRLVLRQMAKAHYVRLNVQNLESFYDKNNKLCKKYGIIEFPTLLVFDSRGKLVKRFEGFVPWTESGNMNEVLSVFE